MPTRRLYTYTSPQRTSRGGGGGGGGGGLNVQNLLDQYQEALAQANQANESRYNDLLGRFEGLQQRRGEAYDQILGNLENLGASGRERIADERDLALGATEQNLISRGLGNTTIRESALRGVRQDAERSLQELNENVEMQRANVLQQGFGMDAQIEQMLGGVIERRTDMGPDLGLYSQLIQQLAAGGGTNAGGMSYNFQGPNPGTVHGGFGSISRTSVGAGGGGGASTQQGQGGGGGGSGGSGARTYTNPGGSRVRMFMNFGGS